jgi:hypothetical protein
MQIFEKNDKMHVHFETFIYHKSLPKYFSAMHSSWLTKISWQNKICLIDQFGRSSNVLHHMCVHWTKIPPCSFRLICLQKIGPSVVRALPLAAGINEGGHYFAYILVRAKCVRQRSALRCHYFAYFNPLLVLTAVIQNHRRGCRRVSNFCMGP